MWAGFIRSHSLTIMASGDTTTSAFYDMVALRKPSRTWLANRKKVLMLQGCARSLAYRPIRPIPGIREIVPQRMERTLVFFSSQRDIRTKQMTQRTCLVHVDRFVMPRSMDTVIILVDRIKHPDDSNC
jgi:hypothetical protein